MLSFITCNSTLVFDISYRLGIFNKTLASTFLAVVENPSCLHQNPSKLCHPKWEAPLKLQFPNISSETEPAGRGLINI